MLPKIFKSKAKYVLSLSREILSIYTISGGSHKITCGKKAIKNLEQFDSKVIEEKIKSFLTETGLKPGKAIIVLEDDVLFFKKIIRGKVSDKRVNEFTSKVPIKSESLVTKIYKIGKRPIIISTNKNFYETFKDILEKQEWKIISVTPHSVLEGLNLNLSSVEEVFDEEEIIKEASFLNRKRKESEINTKPIKIVLFSLIGLVILVPTVFFGYKYFYKKSEGEKVEDKTAVVVEVEDGIEDSSAVEDKIDDTDKLKDQREQVTIQVLNGTGTPGLASSLQKDISELGYEDTSVGNAPTYNFLFTLVRHKEGISGLVIDEIEEYLYTRFEEVTLEEVDSDVQLENDIQITTGQLLENSGGGEELE